ncbi:MAG: TM0996/MTH895 family glutaredoxin-like protein [Phycisphaerae bacterium]|nr:TM0996/MTH895 family glutaredoxin-like protein [Phycisphaerae bacterium]
MKIQILGTGCPKCKKLAENAEQAVAQAGVEAEIEKVTEVAEIAKFGVMFTPAIVIDGVVKSAGKVVAPAKIAGWLE